MTSNPIDERIITQVSRCQDKFITKANYYKDKYIHLISLVTCSVGIIFTTIFYSNKISNDVAVLKDNVKSLKLFIKDGGKILLQDTEYGYLFYASKRKGGKYGNEKMSSLCWKRIYYSSERDRIFGQVFQNTMQGLQRNGPGIPRYVFYKSSHKSKMLMCIISNSKTVRK